MGKKYDLAYNMNGQKMPLHLRRGSFARYTEDAPLFGKYVGTFWRPHTTVGDRKQGEVVKDYQVEVE